MTEPIKKEIRKTEEGRNAATPARRLGEQKTKRVG